MAPITTLRDWLDRLAATDRLAVARPGAGLVHQVAAIANRLDGLVRAGRPLTMDLPRRIEPDPVREYAHIGQGPVGEGPADARLAEAPQVFAPLAQPADEPRPRSQAERDLMKALRLAR